MRLCCVSLTVVIFYSNAYNGCYVYCCQQPAAGAAFNAPQNCCQSTFVRCCTLAHAFVSNGSNVLLLLLAVFLVFCRSFFFAVYSAVSATLLQIHLRCMSCYNHFLSLPPRNLATLTFMDFFGACFTCVLVVSQLSHFYRFVIVVASARCQLCKRTVAGLVCYANVYATLTTTTMVTMFTMCGDIGFCLTLLSHCAQIAIIFACCFCCMLAIFLRCSATQCCTFSTVPSPMSLLLSTTLSVLSFEDLLLLLWLCTTRRASIVPSSVPIAVKQTNSVRRCRLLIVVALAGRIVLAMAGVADTSSY